MSDIFISYAREDRDRVHVLARALESHGWSVFWDRQIPPGVEYEVFISKAIASAKCVIVLWSIASVDSNWVREEAADGRDRKILLPVCIDEVEIPFGFRGLQAANLTRWQGDPNDFEFVQLLNAIAVRLGGTQPVQPTQPHLFIDTTPQNAKIKIPNLGRQFSQGMEFDPGSYLVEVSAEGYKPQRKQIELRSGEDETLIFRLYPINHGKIWLWLVIASIVIIAIVIALYIIPPAPRIISLYGQKTGSVIPMREGTVCTIEISHGGHASMTDAQKASPNIRFIVTLNGNELPGSGTRGNVSRPGNGT